MESPSRRRIEVPRPSADAGLAEWTSRIKALQRDVDADEELEQRRLEEEIRASRLARSRRSGGMQFAGRMSLGTIGAEDEKGSSPADAFRRLEGERPGSPTVFTDHITLPSQRKSSTGPSTSSANTKTEPVSLAAFIGGKATGPRLNKPSPQLDSHDPTLFEQRTRADVVAPHPVFGSGGIALAGLAAKGRDVVETAKTPQLSASESVKENVRPATVNVAPARGMTTTTTLGASANASVNAGSSAPTRSWARERTMSSPSPYTPTKPIKASPPPVIPAGSPGLKGRVESLYANANRSSERVTSPPALRGSKSTDKMAPKPAAPAKPEALRKPQVVSPISEMPLRVSAVPLSASTSTPPPRTLTPGSASPSKAAPTSRPMSVPSLARPIQPQQRPTSTGPQIPQSKNPAPAFLKPVQQKDLTPSLSRLQGRGFVQSVVKLSSEIEAVTKKPGPATPKRPVGASPKRTSVLDRWNPPSPSPSPSTGSGSPLSAPPLRKAKTFDFSRSTAQAEAASLPEPVRPTPRPKPASLAASSTKSTSIQTKSVPVPAPGDVLPLGSSNTLISYIKPTKTGDAPQTDRAETQHLRSKTPSRQADDKDTNELGVRPRSRSSIKSRTPSPSKSASRVSAKSDLASSVPSSGRPLSHPTKDRAKLRRKGTIGQGSSRTEEQQELDEAPADTCAQQGFISDQGTAKQVPASAPVLQVTPVTRQESSSPSAPPQGGPARTPSPQAQGKNTRRVQDTWSNQGPIGVKPLRKAPLATPSPTRSSFGTSAPQVQPKVSKQPLPGLAPQTSEVSGVSPPSPPLTPPLSVSARQERAKSPSSPMKHGRIPSTGSRATVMDVAQAFNANASSTTSAGTPKSAVVAAPPRSPVGGRPAESNGTGIGRDPGGWNETENDRTITPAMMKAERRRSVVERYANFTLPALPEEKTPASSPVGTLKGPVVATASVDASMRATTEEHNPETSGEVSAEKPAPPKKPEFARAPPPKIHIDVVDEPVPAINTAKIWDANPWKFNLNPDVQTVSVEVLNVAGGSTTEITKEEDNGYVFYDSEVLVVIHRAKSRSSGLVATKVWAWIGRKAEVGEREEKKMQELAKRYGTGLTKCGQFSEPQELVHVMGGALVTRQGARSLWSSENTTMHVVRSLAGTILIDEVNLDVKNLCSGFSYCISLLDTVWVWYGCGSVLAERSAALRYAQKLQAGNEDKKVVEVEEGKEDEMFWMFLGEDGYASADHWKWRKSETSADPRVWRVDSANSGSEAKELETFPLPSEVPNSILVVHLAYEIFTLVGSAVRDRRRDIKLGLTLAQELSSYTARSKPFRPPVHVLIFPSQVPLDLRAAIRGLDAETMGSEEVPDHMNLLTLNDAWKQLQQREWDQKELKDRNMMPLGLSPQ